MKLFKLLFLYFLSLTGFLCYGDSSSYYYEAIERGTISTNQNGYGIYYIISGQLWKALPDEVKAEVFQIDPEQIKAFSSYWFNEWDMSSMDKIQADAIYEAEKVFDTALERGTVDITNYAGIQEIYNGVETRAKALIVSPNVEGLIQSQWKGLEQQTNMGMNIRVTGMKPLKIRAFGALPFSEAGINYNMGFWAKNADVANGMQEVVTASVRGADIFSMANAVMEYMNKMTRSVMFIGNSYDIQANMEQNGIGYEAITPQTLHQFYVAEPIGGGGGGVLLALQDIGQDYAEAAKKIGVKDTQQWTQIMESLAPNNIPADVKSAKWIVVPVLQTFNNSDFHK